MPLGSLGSRRSETHYATNGWWCDARSREPAHTRDEVDALSSKAPQPQARLADAPGVADRDPALGEIPFEVAVAWEREHAALVDAALAYVDHRYAHLRKRRGAT